MKVREKYNIKKAFEAECDWDFTIFMVMHYETIDGCTLTKIDENETDF